MARNHVEDFWYHLYKPQRGDVIVDVGAGRGEDVVFFSRDVGRRGRVIAFEPHPRTFAALTNVYKRLNNVTCFSSACMDRSGEFQIETLKNWESNFVFEGGKTGTSHRIDGASLDTVWRANTLPTKIAFLKMNIEGAERLALPGCGRVLQHTRHVCIAAHDFRADRGEGEHFRTLGFVKAFLREQGFKLVTRDNDPRPYVRHHVHGRR